MERKRMVHKEGLLRILFALVVLFLGIADSKKHPPLRNRDEIIPQETIPLHPTMATPLVCTSPETVSVTTDGTNTFVTESMDTLNATTETTPPEPKCLQGWAIFLICLGAVMTVFLLAGIPMMVYCILQSQQLPPQTPPLRYNCKIYTTPEEQAFQLE
ncbi:UNVERIFIED_CONTAM: hypothetical protein K2H54_060005 [Gekko kuhli]